MRDELVKEVTKNEKITELELEIISLRKERLDMLKARHGTSQAQINIPIQILKDKICNLETDLVLKNQRISKLEGLLSEILNVEFWGSQCSVCGMPKQILGDGLNIQNHKPDCLFTRIKKEKNWGNEYV